MNEQQRDRKREVRKQRKKAIKYQNMINGKVTMAAAMRAVENKALVFMKILLKLLNLILKRMKDLRQKVSKVHQLHQEKLLVKLVNS